MQPWQWGDRRRKGEGWNGRGGKGQRVEQQRGQHRNERQGAVNGSCQQQAASYSIQPQDGSSKAPPAGWKVKHARLTVATDCPESVAKTPSCGQEEGRRRCTYTCGSNGSSETRSSWTLDKFIYRPIGLAKYWDVFTSVVNRPACTRMRASAGRQNIILKYKDLCHCLSSVNQLRPLKVYAITTLKNTDSPTRSLEPQNLLQPSHIIYGRRNMSFVCFLYSILFKNRYCQNRIPLARSFQGIRVLLGL